MTKHVSWQELNEKFADHDFTVKGDPNWWKPTESVTFGVSPPNSSLTLSDIDNAIAKLDKLNTATYEQIQKMMMTTAIPADITFNPAAGISGGTYFSSPTVGCPSCHSIVSTSHAPWCNTFAFLSQAPKEVPMPTATVEAPQLRRFANRNGGGYSIPRTQKARGVFALNDHGWGPPDFRLIQDVSDIRRNWHSYSRWFARPCPVRPRHGFIDSHIVTSPAEAETLFAQAQAADPEAEMLLMILMENASWSAIWAPGRLVIGPGNDGATSGHGSISISIARNDNHYALQELAADASIYAPEVPYIEIVANSYATRPVQIRGGPPVDDSSIDYVPHSMTVEHVVRAEGDLLEWETKAADFEPNTVVWHPGGSMLSHYAVHCVLNKVPLLISRRPQIGETLEPTSQKPPITLESVLQGIGAGTVLDLQDTDSRRPAVGALLFGLHNVSAFSGNDGFWLGAAAAIMHRLGGVALIGEARHASDRKKLGRESIYSYGLDNPFLTRRRLRRAQWLFHNYGWSNSFGGEAWAKCGTALLELDEAIRLFVQDPSHDQYTCLGSALNQAVNQAHNGGWWLNKFTDEILMDYAAQGHPRAAMAALTTLGTLTQIPKNEITQALLKWKSTRAIPVPEPELLSFVRPAGTPPPVGITHIQGKFVQGADYDGDHVHLQYQVYGNPKYLTKDVPLSDFGVSRATAIEIFSTGKLVNSLSGGNKTQYRQLEIIGKWVMTSSTGFYIVEKSKL